MAETAEPTPPVAPPADPPVQFTLRSLLLLQLLCAIFFALLVTIHIFAVLLLFVATLVLAAIRVRPENVALKRACIDLLGGVILPVLCFMFDPIIRVNQFSLCLTPDALNFVYTAVFVQIVMFLIWRLAGRWMNQQCAEFFAGVLWAGVAIALLFGVLLTPFSLLGLMVMGVGALGFTPFLTAIVFRRNALRAMGCDENRLRAFALVLLGAAPAILVPALLYRVAGPIIALALNHIRMPTGGFPFP